MVDRVSFINFFVVEEFLMVDEVHCSLICLVKIIRPLNNWGQVYKWVPATYCWG